jgi:hypothetical protein
MLRILSVENYIHEHVVNKLPGFLDAQNANLFVVYAKTRFKIKFEQSKFGAHFLFDKF